MENMDKIKQDQIIFNRQPSIRIESLIKIFIKKDVKRIESIEKQVKSNDVSVSNDVKNCDHDGDLAECHIIK